jgi:SAM-dependent methyltransferase
MIMDFARSALSFPVVYDSYQSLVGAPRCHQRFITEMVRPKPGGRVLDIGCGVGASVRYLPAGVGYVGIDVSQPYIDRARADYAGRGEFLCADAGAVDATTIGQFDLAFSFGVLHHLSDEIVGQVIKLVRAVVRPGGRFVTIDPCYVVGQNAIARLLIDNDRGEFVRDASGYAGLMAGFGDVRATVHHDLLRIPYTQIVMQVELCQ